MSIRATGVIVCALIAGAIANGVGQEISHDLALLRSSHQIEESTRLRSLIGRATVELSVGRSLTQVALALPDPISPELRATLDAQRLKSAPLFEDIRSLAQGASALRNADEFIREFDNAVASLSLLRMQADAEMAKPLSQRDATALKVIPSRIKSLVRSTFDTSALLEPQNVSVSSAVMLGLAVQRYSWEIREYGGRERTHFVIAAATRKPIEASALAEMEIQAGRAAQAWREIDFLLRASEMPQSIKDAAFKFKENYFGSYASLRREMMASADTGAYPLDFKAFFNRSGDALATAAVLSRAGADFALQAADASKSDALRGLSIAIATGLVSLVILVFLTWFVMIRISGRIREAAAIARAISIGKFDNRICPQGKDEVTMLVSALATMQSSLVDKIGRIESLAADAQAQAVQLSLQNGRFEAALDNMTQGLCMFDEASRLVVHNRRFEEMFGSPSHDVSSESLGVLDILTAPRKGQPASRTYEMPDGRVMAVSHGLTAHGGWVSTYEDVTERHRIAATLERMARYDILTLLPNRMFFLERLDEALAKGRGLGPAVLCLDLDGFKTVNDTLGHTIGDGLLRAVAQRLLDCVRPGDVVGRLGGDEFAIVQNHVESWTETEALANRIIRAIDIPFDVDGFRVTVGISIGIAREDKVLGTSLGERAAALLKNADIALYRAKVEGRGTYRLFAPEMHQKLQARRVLELDLRGAIEKEQFELYFQPLVETGDGSVCCFEALLRWNHPEKGVISPAEFIPVAEETGLIKPIGRWVLQRACTIAGSWPPEIKVAVNLSPVQFQNPFLASEVVAALDVSGLSPRRLELEITESVLILEDEMVLNTLHQMRALGVRVALDDFGTGYSSLSYLHRFPFDKLKIDRSFVADLADKGKLAIVRSIMGLGKALNIDVVAEGVETQEQESILINEGCTELQGYYFSPPRPAQDINGMIDRGRVPWGGVAFA